MVETKHGPVGVEKPAGICLPLSEEGEGRGGLELPVHLPTGSRDDAAAPVTSSPVSIK